MVRRWARFRIGSGALGLLTISFLAGCAYYNTFYFAKKYYAQGERLRESGASEELVPPEAVHKYDQAIVQCRKVLTFHQKSRWVDDALYLLGASYYGKAEYDSALIAFADLERNFPESKFVDEAIYTRALCRYEQGEFDLMRVEFDRVLDRNARFQKKDEILYTLARTAEQEEDKATAIRRYRDLVESHPGTKRGEDGLLAIGRLYFADEDYANAISAYDELVRRTKNAELYQEGQLQLAQALMRTGRAEDAVRLLEHEVPPGPADTQRNAAENDYAARVRIALAQAKNRLGEHEDAVEVLRVVTDKYASSTYACEAQYLIGYTFESYLDSLSSAEKAYDLAAKMSSRSSFREIAQNRLINVRRLMAEGAGEGEAKSDTDLEVAAGAALKIAELQYFAERDRGGALAQYRAVIDEYPTSSVAPRASYAIGWIHLRDPKAANPDSAYHVLRETVRQFPASDQARAAIDLLVAEKADTTGLRALLVEPEPEPPPPTTASPLEESAEPPRSGLEEGDRVADLRRRFLEDELEESPARLDSLRRARAAEETLGGLRRPGESPATPRWPADSLGVVRERGDSLGVVRMAPDSLGVLEPVDSLGSTRLLGDSLDTERAPADSLAAPRADSLFTPEEEPRTPVPDPEPGWRGP